MMINIQEKYADVFPSIYKDVSQNWKKAKKDLEQKEAQVRKCKEDINTLEQEIKKARIHMPKAGEDITALFKEERVDMGAFREIIKSCNKYGDLDHEVTNGHIQLAQKQCQLEEAQEVYRKAKSEFDSIDHFVSK